MNQTNETTSPESDLPLADRTVGALVAEHPNLSRVFQAHDIGFCCQGKRTVREACERKGVFVEEVVADLEREKAGTPPSSENPAKLEPRDLAEYIVEVHHGFLRRELPRIHAMAERVAEVHGGHTPSLIEVYKVFTDMANELGEHAVKEEQVLFPAITRLAAGEAAGVDVGGPVDCMMEEHEETENALNRLRELTHSYQPPEDACNTYRALFAGLADLESDTRTHIHLENNVLFPRALQMAGAA